ncbi:MAG: cell division protein ZapA [Candidatus Tectimicrobiota bacterium]|nr:MAG: cell division protein ZapA [Candidatus Tectomicrobia bacterium]
MAEDIEVTILGQRFRIAAGEASPAYLQQLAGYVDERLRAVASTSKAMPLNRMAILAALNIADDLFKLRQHYEHTARLLDAKAEQLIALVQAQLAEA